MLFNNKKEYNKCFLRKLSIIVLLLFVVLFIGFLNTDDVDAVSITSGIYSTAIYTKNYESSKTIYNTGPNTIPFYSFLVNSPTGIWDYVQALSFPNPFTNKTGTGYESSVFFTMRSTNGNFLNTNLLSYLANVNLGFENLSEDLPYCTRNYEARLLDGQTVQFVIQSSCPYGSYSQNTSFDQVEVSVDYFPESIFWCANDNLSQSCPSSNFGIMIIDIDYYFNVITTAQDSYNQTIINQNQTIINQNQAFYDHEYHAENNISNQSTSDIPNSESAQTTSIIGTISSFISAIQNVQGTNCQLTLPFPSFVGGSTTVDVCTAKDKAPQIVTIGSSMLLIGTFIPLAFIVLKMIFNEIRSWTNG